MIGKDIVTAAAALAHSVPGAELLLRRTDGARLVVAGHSRADLSPCTFRHLVAEGPCPIAEEVETWLGSVEPRGTLEHAVAGVYRSRHRAGERWFVADLDSARLRQLFDDLDCDREVADSTSVTLRADVELGVVVVKLEVGSRFSVERVDQLALCVYASYLAEVAMCASKESLLDQGQNWRE
ncbi:MAG TPA: hypothetical protein DCL16_03870 [Acidimicrobiaceae bacterium]|nr:hypothetical protein [Acidimicrobiaceae bacterium]